MSRGLGAFRLFEKCEENNPVLLALFFLGLNLIDILGYRRFLRNGRCRAEIFRATNRQDLRPLSTVQNWL